MEKLNINNQEIRVININDPEELIIGKYFIEESLIEKHIIKEKTSIPTFLKNIINMSNYVYIKDIFDNSISNSLSLSFDIININNIIYLFVSDKKDPYKYLFDKLVKINFDMTKIISFDTPAEISDIIRHNGYTYVFPEDNENV